MDNKFRLDSDKELKKAIIKSIIKHDLDKPLFEMDRNDMIYYYQVVHKLRGVRYYFSDLDRIFDNDLYILDSKLLFEKYKCIYGSIVSIFKDIVYFFRNIKRLIIKSLRKV